VINCEIIPNSTLPGGFPAMGNVTDEVLDLMGTPATTIQMFMGTGGTFTKTGYVLKFTDDPVITTYSPKTGFTKVQGLPAVQAMPMKLKTIQDAEGTNWSWQILLASNKQVKNTGAYAGQDLVPHIDGDESNKIDGVPTIRLVPIQAKIYKQGLGGASDPTYFDARNSNATYAKVPESLFVTENNLKVTVNGSDVYIFLSSTDDSMLRTLCRYAGGSCFDDTLKEWVANKLNITLLGNSIRYDRELGVGKKLR
jgi:hypothetical protein